MMERANRVEQGSDNSKERYEIVDSGDSLLGGDDKEEEDAFFYFNLPDSAIQTASVTESATAAAADDVSNSKKKTAALITNMDVMAPPPPNKPNAQGECVVTVYSSTDTNEWRRCLDKISAHCNTAQCNVVAVVMVRAAATAYRRGEKGTIDMEEGKNLQMQQSTIGYRSNNQQQTTPTTVITG